METVRVSVDLLDRIMTLAGEIVLSRNQMLRQELRKGKSAEAVYRRIIEEDAVS